MKAESGRVLGEDARHRFEPTDDHVQTSWFGTAAVSEAKLSPRTFRARHSVDSNTVLRGTALTHKYPAVPSRHLLFDRGMHAVVQLRLATTTRLHRHGPNTCRVDSG